MEQKRPELFSTGMAAGSRTYFFDVKESVNGTRYLKITESRRDPEGEFEHSRVIVYEQGRTLGELAAQFGRQPGGIQSRLRKLDLMQAY
jgi:hypothetical protein